MRVGVVLVLAALTSTSTALQEGGSKVGPFYHTVIRYDFMCLKSV